MDENELKKEIEELIEACGGDISRLTCLAKLLSDKYYEIRAKIALTVANVVTLPGLD